jgi:hypothetical protein
MRLLAVHSTKRLSDFPDVQTFRELGYDFVNETLPMVLVPKGTPEAIVTKLDDVLKRAMEEKEYRDILKKFDWEYKYLGHEDLKKYIDQTYLEVGNVIKKSGTDSTDVAERSIWHMIDGQAFWLALSVKPVSNPCSLESVHKQTRSRSCSFGASVGLGILSLDFLFRL